MVDEERHEKQKEKVFRPYPGGPLLEKERKIADRGAKEKRPGVKHLRHGVGHPVQRERASHLLDEIYCGDAEAVLKSFPDSFVDLVITSPPYNFGQ